MRKITKWHILTIGLSLFAGAILFLWWGLYREVTYIDKLFSIIAMMLLLLISSIFIVLFVFSFSKAQNVFLYDKKIKKDINVEDLTFDKVCEFLDLYIRLIFQNRKQLLFTDIFKIDLGNVPKVYHPLIQMRLLILWIEESDSDKWMLFANCDKNYIDKMEDTLHNLGEYKISFRLHYLWSTYSGDDSEIKDFFLKNLEYLEEFILNYVKVNIDSYT